MRNRRKQYALNDLRQRPDWKGNFFEGYNNDSGHRVVEKRFNIGPPNRTQQPDFTSWFFTNEDRIPLEHLSVDINSYEYIDKDGDIWEGGGRSWREEEGERTLGLQEQAAAERNMMIGERVSGILTGLEAARALKPVSQGNPFGAGEALESLVL